MTDEEIDELFERSKDDRAIFAGCEVRQLCNLAKIGITSKNHIEEAYKLLTGEVWRGPTPDNMAKVDGICVIVMELDRVDCAIGPKGESMFARLAETIQAAYVEITAARKTFIP